MQRFSVAISDVWDYRVTANGDRATFTELLVTTAPLLLQEPFLSDRPKSTRSCLGNMTHLTASSLSTFRKSKLLPSSKLDTVLFCVFCVVCVCGVCTVGYFVCECGVCVCVPFWLLCVCTVGYFVCVCVCTVLIMVCVVCVYCWIFCV